MRWKVYTLYALTQVIQGCARFPKISGATESEVWINFYSMKNYRPQTPRVSVVMSPTVSLNCVHGYSNTLSWLYQLRFALHTSFLAQIQEAKVLWLIPKTDNVVKQASVDLVSWPICLFWHSESWCDNCTSTQNRHNWGQISYFSKWLKLDEMKVCGGLCFSIIYKIIEK